jgi:adenylate cyclase
LFRVPIAPGQLAGVDLHAQRLAALLERERGRRPGLTAAPCWLNGALLFVAGLAGVGLGEGLGSLRRSVALVALLGGGGAVAGLALLLLGGVWLNLSLPLAALLMMATAAWIGRGAEQQGQRQQMQRLLGQTISPAVARELWSQRRSLLAGDRFRARRLFVTVLIADIAGFTALAERLGPEALLAWLNRTLEVVIGPIDSGGGLVNKFTGDGLLAVFGAPLSQGREADARAALAAAGAIRHGIGALNGELAAAGQPLVRLRLGLHSGWVLAGSVGSRERWEYGVVGDAVNCAARIDALAGPPLSDGCRILVSAVSRDLAGAGGAEGGEANGGGGQPWGAMPLGGRREPMEIWEL